MNVCDGWSVADAGTLGRLEHTLRDVFWGERLITASGTQECFVLEIEISNIGKYLIELLQKMWCSWLMIIYFSV